MNEQTEDDQSKLKIKDNTNEGKFCIYEAFCHFKIKNINLYSLPTHEKQDDEEDIKLPHFFFNLTHNTYLLAISIGAFMNNYDLLKIGII